jgi:hypothetical protein
MGANLNVFRYYVFGVRIASTKLTATVLGRRRKKSAG